MNFQILGVGTAVPRGFVTQEDAARLALQTCVHDQQMAATLPTLYENTQIRTRHSVLVDSSSNGQMARQAFFPSATGLGDRGPSTAPRMQRYEAEAADLAARAASGALEDAGCAADAISHLVTVSCSGFSAPGVDVGLIERLELRRDVSRTHVGFMGCHGAMNGLRVAAALAGANRSSKVLLCCVEICSIHFQYPSEFQHLVANALFSDGAAAVVGTASGTQRDDWQLLDQRSFVVPHTADLMSWRIGDHGFEMTLSAQVSTTIRDTLRAWLEDWLVERGLEIDEVRGWIVHPGGPHILSACSEALELPRECLRASYDVLAQYGNMSSPTVLFILERLRQVVEALPCVMLAFGPGLTIEGALFC